MMAWCSVLNHCQTDGYILLDNYLSLTSKQPASVLAVLHTYHKRNKRLCEVKRMLIQGETTSCIFSV
ncbi:hypothetical protein M404DRAFT_747878 [Pisolithus tinctorius Marx 270]|uniref:Uncharacterized protein n=1 Tax=Pisolithus tinctorius Marx 270 TaxID=870435 RepID=A0A0C3PE24_PISTI|nr:hypothetical protein M404DRAFT_747878 [Pisolithus tinctorius Marx 270]